MYPVAIQGYQHLCDNVVNFFLLLNHHGHHGHWCPCRTWPLSTCVGILGWPPGTCADGPGWPLGTGLFCAADCDCRSWQCAQVNAGRRFALWPLWTYELSRMTHMTAFLKYGKHSTWPSTYGLWIRTYRKSFSCKSLLTICCYKAQSNEICMYGRVSRGLFREFVGTACCTYGQSNTTIETWIDRE